MRIVAEQYPFVINVDAHAARQCLAVIDAHNAAVVVVDQREFPATGAGLSRAVEWVVRWAGPPQVSPMAIEGIGS